MSGSYTDDTMSVMWVPKAECPKCHTQQSFDEYNRGIARCQLCEVYFSLVSKAIDYLHFNSFYLGSHTLRYSLRPYHIFLLAYSFLSAFIPCSLTYFLYFVQGSFRRPYRRWPCARCSASLERCFTGLSHYSWSS